MESELKMRETTRKTVANRLYAGCNTETTCSEGADPSSSYLSEKDNMNRMWEENRRRHAEAERRLLYPTDESICHSISFERVVHDNLVAFSQQRYRFRPVIAEETRERYKHYSKVTKQYKRLMERWRATHHDDDDSDTKTSRGWKEDDNKREKRAMRERWAAASPVASRTIVRFTRSQTSNMVECESLTSRVGAAATSEA